MSRVVIVVDRYDVQVLENHEDVDIEVIHWGLVAEDLDVPDYTYTALDDALCHNKIDEALEIYKGLTEDVDDGYDEDPKVVNP